MSVKKYKDKYTSKNRFYDSTIAKVASYPISAASYGTGIAADRGKDVMDWVGNWGIVAGVLIAILFFVWLLIKWRR